MKVQELMERVGINQTGRAIAYIKDGLEEMNLISETNIVKGTNVSVTGTGISFNADNTTAGSVWSATSFTQLDALQDAIGQTDWTVDEGTVSAQFRTFNIDGVANGTDQLSMNPDGGTGGVKIYSPAITVKPGFWYSVTTNYKMVTGEIPGTNSLQPVLASDVSTIAYSDYSNDPATPTSSVGPLVSTGAQSHTHNFLISPGVTSIKLQWTVTIIDHTSNYLNIDDVWVYPRYQNIIDTNNGFGNFTTDMKLLVEGTASNNTNLTANTSTGYYTMIVATAGGIQVSDSLTTESAGNNFIIRGQSSNYSDIIKDKRFYPIPSEAIKITDIKVKNHLNTDDQWRSIPRMVGKPLNTDKDEI